MLVTYFLTASDHVHEDAARGYAMERGINVSCSKAMTQNIRKQNKQKKRILTEMAKTVKG